jgi:hypothetical protein
VSNLQLADGVFFEQNDNLMKFNTKNGTLVQLSNFKAGKRLGRTRNRIIFKNPAKELFLFIRDQRLVRNGTKRNQMKLNQISLRNILW